MDTSPQFFKRFFRFLALFVLLVASVVVFNIWANSGDLIIEIAIVGFGCLVSLADLIYNVINHPRKDSNARN